MRRGPARRHVVTAAALLAAALIISTTSGCCSLIQGGTNGTGRGAIEPTLPPLPLAGKVGPPESGAYLGVYTPPAPFGISRVDTFEKEAGKSVSIVMWYQPWAAGNRSRLDTAAVVAVMRRGKVPMITWEPWNPGSNARTVRDPGSQRAYKLARINAGEFDGYITEWARGLRALGGPVMLRPMHEMNGTWYPWSGTTNGNSPAAFVAAWRRLHDIFEREGATNVTWVWSVNADSIPPTKENAYAAYYPGDDYVDWTAISGFQRGVSATDHTWRPFVSLYTEPLRYLATLRKPICIAEMASLGQGPDRAAWIADAYARIESANDVKAVVYFDSRESGPNPQDWRVAAHPESLAAFRTAVASPYWVGRSPAVLTGWAGSLDTTQSGFLLSFAPVY